MILGSLISEMGPSASLLVDGPSKSPIGLLFNLNIGFLAASRDSAVNIEMNAAVQHPWCASETRCN